VALIDPQHSDSEYDSSGSDIESYAPPPQEATPKPAETPTPVGKIDIVVKNEFVGFKNGRRSEVVTSKIDKNQLLVSKFGQTKQYGLDTEVLRV
jgi:hypothetical protein